MVDKVNGDQQCEFWHDSILSRYSAFGRYWRNNRSTMEEYIS
jgi:hypothetical protein